MRNPDCLVTGTLVLALLAGAAMTEAQTTPPAGGAPAAPTTASRPAAAERAAQAKLEADECGKRVVAFYLGSKWTELDNELRLSTKHTANMSPQVRTDVLYVRQGIADCRPAWWKSCRSSSSTSFQASIWGRTFWANYMPSDMMLGGTAPIGVKDGKLVCVVTWKPTLVDSAGAAKGYLAKRHGITLGDQAEMIVWHELGHNYVTSFLPLPTVMELYMKYEMLFSSLQEFYADMTALYHASPLARRVAMLTRIDELEDYRDTEPHARAAHAVASLILAEALANPAKWPSFHLPNEVPKEDPERNTIVYMYENMDPNWSLAEDKALRESVNQFMRISGEQVLRKKGEVPLPNKLFFTLTATDDRDHKPKRDAWVKEQLEKAIKAGQTDKAPAKKEHEIRLVVPW